MAKRLTDNTFIRIITWLGVMAVMAIITTIIWMIAFHGSNSISALKWIQFMQTVGIFLLPPVICAWFWNNHKPFRWLQMQRIHDWKIILLAIATMICAIPGINFLAEWNSHLALPDSLDSIEKFLQKQEQDANALTLQFLQANNAWTLLINIGLLALLPAIGEEMTFRGTLQQIVAGSDKENNIKVRTHIAIWVVAIIFSAIHMQFYGFIPRMLMGAMFGYVLVWTGCLWVPIIMHFTNNCVAVLSYHFLEGNNSWIENLGIGSTKWLGIVSIVGTIALLWLIYKLTIKNK